MTTFSLVYVKINQNECFTCGNMWTAISKRCSSSVPTLDIQIYIQVMFFTGVCDSVKGGCYPRMHCRWYPSMPCSRCPGGCLVLGGLLLGGVPAPRGCLLPGGVWPSIMAFCCGLLLCPSVMAFWFGGLLIEKAWPSGGAEGHHTRRP